MNPTIIIMPTYNERENLPRMAEHLLKLPVPVDLLVVDDNSPDGTGKMADELAVKHPEIHVLHREEKNGLGRAYIAGFKWALEHGYEFIFEMDGDFSHNPDDVPMFIEATKNADLVLGSRYKGGIRVVNWPLKRLMLSRGAGKYVQLVTGMRPGEVVLMRACDIDMSGKTWEYRPESHKTEHHGIERVIFLGPRAQTIARPFLKRDLQAHLFSPKDALADLQQRRAEPHMYGGDPINSHARDGRARSRASITRRRATAGPSTPPAVQLVFQLGAPIACGTTPPLFCGRSLALTRRA